MQIYSVHPKGWNLEVTGVMIKQALKKKTGIDNKRVKLLIKEGEGLTLEFKEKYTAQIP